MATNAAVYLCSSSNPTTQGYAGTNDNAFGSAYSYLLLRVLSVGLISSYRSMAASEKSNRAGSYVIAAVSHLCFQIQNTHQCPLETSVVHVSLNCDRLPAWRKGHQSLELQRAYRPQLATTVVLVPLGSWSLETTRSWAARVLTTQCEGSMIHVRVVHRS